MSSTQMLAIFYPVLRQLILVFGAGAAVTLFVCFGNASLLKYTPIGWTHQMLARVLTAGSDTLNQWCCGNRFVMAARVYVFESLNPLMQIVYLVLVLGGYLLFLRDIYPYMGRDFLYVHTYLSHFCVALTMLSFFLACYSDPGVITRANLEQHKDTFPYDNLLYKPKECETCKIQRPARSKHCRLCNVCVSRFDHHCPWINVCVGERNVRLFILFLLMTAFICLYESWLSFQLARLHYAQLSAAWSAQLASQRRPLVPLPSQLALAHLLHDLNFAVPLGLFCFLMGLVVLAFAFYHIYLVIRNTTTNETFKWQDVTSTLNWYKRRQAARARLLADRAAGRAPPSKSKATTTTASNGGDADAQSRGKSKRSNDDDDSDAEIDTIEMPTEAQLNNTYNRGALANLREVLFPPSLYTKPKAH